MLRQMTRSGIMEDAGRVAALMGGKRVLGRHVETISDLRSAVESGLPKAALKNVVQHLARDGSTQRALMHKMVPEATLRRVGRRLSLTGSERTERLARTTALALEVWGDNEDARTFMTTPHAMLQDRTPAEMALTDLGAREVEAILRSIAYGHPI
jgi:putative toxin-antitoxin system antitoxin component (TIGR02293 family)